MVVVVPFLVESELFHGGVVEDQWLSVAPRAHRLNQGLATFDCAAAAMAVVLPRAFQVLAGPGAARSDCLRGPQRLPALPSTA